MTVINIEHAIGALVGSAVGDALGAPFEFQRPGLYRATFPTPVLGGAGEMQGGGSFNWRPAEFTDDTQMAIALAESLVANGGFEADDLWRRWQTWSHHARDVGMQTRQVLAERSHVGAAERVHARNDGRSAGNGSVMRNTPIALWAAEDSLESLVELARQQATLTHHDPHNAYGAAIHGAMVRAGIRGEDMFAAIGAALDVLPAAARGRWESLLAPGWHPDPAGTNATVWSCLAEAVWAVRNATSFEDALVNAVDLGRDADTVACVAGGIAGARWGVQAIPSRWTAHLHGTITGPDGVRRYDYAALQALARKLLGRHAAADAADEAAGGPAPRQRTPWKWR